MFNCDFDFCVGANGFLLGIIASIIATVLTNLYISNKTRIRFNKVLGTYLGYGFEDERANPLIRKEASQSMANVTYKERNILHIEVEHDNRKWDGDITMENENFGTVVWRYVDLPENQHSFGFKRLMVREEDNKICLYLVGEWSFGREVFIRTHDNNKKSI